MAFLRTMIGIGIATFLQQLRSAFSVSNGIVSEDTGAYFITEDGIYIVGE